MPMTLTYFNKNWLWLMGNCIAFLLFVWAIWQIWQAPLTLRPTLFATDSVRDIGLFTGKTALILLILSLACTPLSQRLKWNRVLTVRKSLGLWCFGFAVLHMCVTLTGTSFLANLDAWTTVGETMWNGWLYGPWNGNEAWGKMPYAAMGFYALMLLVPLMLTSSRRAMRLLGKNWKRLHRLVYLAALLAIWHYLWKGWHQSKWGLPSGASGEGFVQPLLFAAVVAILLLLRIPRARNRALLGKR